MKGRGGVCKGRGRLSKNEKKCMHVFICMYVYVGLALSEIFLLYVRESSFVCVLIFGTK